MYGSIRFETFPSGADIIIDGMSQNATTPCIITYIPCGEYTFELQLDGYSTVVGTINVISDIIIDVYAFMYPYIENFGYIEIFSIPEEAIVFIDDSQIDIKTPAVITYVPPGEHTVILKKKGYEDYIIIVNIDPGKMVLIDVMLIKSHDIGNNIENIARSMMLMAGVLGTVTFVEKAYKGEEFLK